MHINTDILSPKQKAGTIMVNGTALAEVEENTYLRVIYKRLTLKPYISHAESKAQKKNNLVSIFWKLASST